MNDDEIIDFLRANSKKPARDEHTQPRLCPPASDQEIEEAESALGFDLPPLLKRIYREIGNGGNILGPAHGVYGVGNGYSFAGQNAVGKTLHITRDHPWLKGFLLVAEGGCGLAFLVDCGDAEYPVYCYNGDEIAPFMIDEGYDNEEPPEEGWEIESDTFAEWLTQKNYNIV